MKLGLAKEKLSTAAPADTARATQLVDDAHRGAIEAIADLRVLARGIHPPVLDNGLADALATLAARSALPVELVTDLPDRPSAAIETIAYFFAAELLTNAARGRRRRLSLRAAVAGYQPDAAVVDVQARAPAVRLRPPPRPRRPHLPRHMKYPS